MNIVCFPQILLTSHLTNGVGPDGNPQSMDPGDAPMSYRYMLVFCNAMPRTGMEPDNLLEYTRVVHVDRYQCKFVESDTSSPYWCCNGILLYHTPLEYGIPSILPAYTLEYMTCTRG